MILGAAHLFNRNSEVFVNQSTIVRSNGALQLKRFVPVYFVVYDLFPGNDSVTHLNV